MPENNNPKDIAKAIKNAGKQAINLGKALAGKGSRQNPINLQEVEVVAQRLPKQQGNASSSLEPLLEKQAVSGVSQPKNRWQQLKQQAMQNSRQGSILDGTTYGKDYGGNYGSKYAPTPAVPKVIGNNAISRALAKGKLGKILGMQEDEQNLNDYNSLNSANLNGVCTIYIKFSDKIWPIDPVLKKNSARVELIENFKWYLKQNKLSDKVKIVETEKDYDAISSQLKQADIHISVVEDIKSTSFNNYIKIGDIAGATIRNQVAIDFKFFNDPTRTAGGQAFPYRSMANTMLHECGHAWFDITYELFKKYTNSNVSENEFLNYVMGFDSKGHSPSINIMSSGDVRLVYSPDSNRTDDKSILISLYSETGDPFKFVTNKDAKLDNIDLFSLAQFSVIERLFNYCAGNTAPLINFIKEYQFAKNSY